MLCWRLRRGKVVRRGGDRQTDGETQTQRQRRVYNMRTLLTWRPCRLRAVQRRLGCCVTFNLNTHPGLIQTCIQRVKMTHVGFSVSIPVTISITSIYFQRLKSCCLLICVRGENQHKASWMHVMSSAALTVKLLKYNFPCVFSRERLRKHSLSFLDAGDQINK